MTCYNTDIFETVLDKIFLKFPNIKNKEISCLYAGFVINERVSVEENKIVDGANILIDINDFAYLTTL